MLISIKTSDGTEVWREDCPGSARKTGLLAFMRLDETAPESIETILTLQREQIKLESEEIEVSGRKFCCQFKERYGI